MLKLKLNADMGGYKAGTILPIEKFSTPYWRRRIKDAKKDNCVELIIEPTIEKLADEFVENGKHEKRSRKYKRKQKNKED